MFCGIQIDGALVISAQKEQSIPVARLREPCSGQRIEQFGKIQGIHGGSLVDFGNALTQSSFPPQYGQRYGVFCTAGITSRSLDLPIRYLATARRFLLLGAINP